MDKVFVTMLIGVIWLVAFPSTSAITSTCRPTFGHSYESTGKEYMLMFLYNSCDQCSHPELEVAVVAEKFNSTSEAKVSVQVFRGETPIDGSTNPVQLRNGFATFSLDRKKTEMGQTETEGKKCVVIRADQKVEVYGINKERHTSDGFKAIALDGLGRNYYAVAYDTQERTQKLIGIVAAHKGQTFVQIRSTVHDAQQQLSKNITLQYRDTYQLRYNRAGDISGTFITSSRPIAVFSGNSRTAVYKEVPSASRDHLVSQLPPVEVWGYTFLICPSNVGQEENDEEDKYVVIAAQKGTTITVRHFAHSRTEKENVIRWFSKKNGHKFSVWLSRRHQGLIKANKQILVVRIRGSQNGEHNPVKGDPSMVTIPAVEHYLADGSEFAFITTKYVGAGRGYKHYISFMATGKSMLQELDHSGGGGWKNVDVKWYDVAPATATTARYQCALMEVNSGSHRFRVSGYQLGAIAYGVGDRESYDFPIAMRYNGEGCLDDYDNDCDGRTDEEICDGKDNDNDGAIDEDCRSAVDQAGSKCHHVVSRCHDCYRMGQLGTYRGETSKAIGDKKCLPWNDRSLIFTTLDSQNRILNEILTADGDITHNFCRNPRNAFDVTGKETPWCYIFRSRTHSDNKKAWEYCDIPTCPASTSQEADRMSHRGDPRTSACGERSNDEDAFGERFYTLMFPKNQIDSNEQHYLPLKLLVASLERGKKVVVTVKNFQPGSSSEELFQQVTINPLESMKVISIPRKYEGNSIIRVEGSHNIIVYGINSRKYSSDGFLAIGDKYLGMRHFIMTYPTCTSKAFPGEQDKTCGFSVAAHKSANGMSTTVRYKGPHSANFVELKWYGKGLNTSSTNGSDIIGTFVTSSQPVAVFGSNGRVSVDPGHETGGASASRDYMVEQMPAVDHWGKEFILCGTPGRYRLGDVYYIIAAQDNTKVTVNRGTTSHRFYTLNRGKYSRMAFTSSHQVHITASSPILVGKFTLSQDYLDGGKHTKWNQHDLGDPSMILIPAVTQYGSKYTFLPTNSTGGGEKVDYKHYLSIMTKYQVPSITVEEDGPRRDLPLLHIENWYKAGTSGYYCGEAKVNEASQHIRRISRDGCYKPFGAILYGLADDESYGYPLGMILKQLVFDTNNC